MQNVLIVTSSAQGDQSVSGRLAGYFADRLRAAHPGVRIVSRDLDADPVPHLTNFTVAGIRAEARTEAEHIAQALSDRLIEEIRAADLVVIASPMYNFGISSTLKSWFDHVLRPRVAFRYSEAGPEGLLGGRRVVVIESRAGAYEAGAPNDSQEPHLRTMLAFMGLDDVRFVRAEGLAFGADAAAAAIAAAEAELDTIAGAALAEAA
jgi:FMN-dependent NADH-azoreductase